MPHILSGASCGSLIAAHVCCRTDDELKLTLNAEVSSATLLRYIDRLICLFLRPLQVRWIGLMV
jgi:predicted acylesterase/phospholipase RssA